MIRTLCLVYPDMTPLPEWFAKISSLPSDPVLLPPLGLLYVAASTRREVAVLDNRVERLDLEALLERLAGFDAVGFSGTIFEADQALAAARRLGEIGIPTIYGGPNASANWDLYPGTFTAIVRGEGELVLDALLDALEAGRRPPEFEEWTGTWVNPHPARIEALDALAWPDRGLIPLERYHRREAVYLPGLEPVDTVVSSRGCPFACSFCSSQVLWGRRATMRAAQAVVAEMRHLAGRWGTQAVYFREDNFTASRARLLECCRAAGALGMPWLCESRVDTLDRNTIRSMRDAGCAGIWFGIESTSPATLARIHKGITLAQARTTIALCREAGIRTGGSFIVGLPHEPRAEILATLRESHTLGLDQVYINRCWAVPRTALHDEIMAKGLDRRRFGAVVIPDTESLHADAVTELYWRHTNSWKMRLARRLLPERAVAGLDRAARRLLRPAAAAAKRSREP